MSPALAIWPGRSRRRASVRYLRRRFMAHPTTPSTMKTTSHNRISTAIQSIRLIEKDLLWNTALHDFQIQLEAPTTKEKPNENHTDPDYHNYIAVLQRLR